MVRASTGPAAGDAGRLFPVMLNGAEPEGKSLACSPHRPGHPARGFAPVETGPAIVVNGGNVGQASNPPEP